MSRGILMVNLSERLAVMDDGEVVPVTNLFDWEGFETSDPEEAVAFVAGPDSRGYWWSDAAHSYAPGRLN